MNDERHESAFQANADQRKRATRTGMLIAFAIVVGVAITFLSRIYGW